MTTVAPESPPQKPSSSPSDAETTACKPRFIRYIILAVAVICLSSMMANIISFNFAVLCMPARPSSNETVGYDQQERTMIFSAVAVGALLAIAPVSLLIPILGPKTVFLISGAISAFATALIPMAATADFRYFLGVRVIQGMSFAAAMPIVGSITASWASLKQNGLFMSVLTTFGQISAVFSMPLSGQLCESSLGWQSIFYVHSVISICAFSLWAFLYYNHPEEHPCVTEQELAEISEGKVEPTKENEPIPYWAILTTPTVWGVWVGALGDLIAVQLVHTFSPIYIRQVLGYSVHKTGWAAALPVLAQFFVKVFAGHSSDRLRGVSETTKLRVYNTVALGASAAFMIALAFVQKGQGVVGVVLLTLTTAMFGFNGGGFNKCATLVSRQHSHFVLANIAIIWCLSMLLCPVLVGILLPSGAASEWRVVYLLHAAILILSNAVFCWLATAKAAPWTKAPSAVSLRRNTPFFA